MDKRKLIWRILQYLLPYRICILLAVSCFSISGLISFCIPLVNQKLIDFGFLELDFYYILKLATLLLFLYIINESLYYIKQRIRVYIYKRLRVRLFSEYCQHLMHVPFPYLWSLERAEFSNNLNMDIDNMLLVADEGIVFIGSQIFAIVGGIVGLWIIDPRLFVVFVVFIPLKVMVLCYLSNRRENAITEYLKRMGRQTGMVSEMISGMDVIRVFGLQDRIWGKTKEEIAYSSKLREQAEMVSQENLMADSILVHFLTYGIYIIGGFLVFSMELSVGSVFAFVTYGAYLSAPISTILNTRYIFAGIFPSAERYFRFIDLEGELAGNIKIEGDISDIRFHKVGFSYNKSWKLRDISFEIQKGDKFVIVGENGTGKTTLLNLILRCVNPTHGEISLDGRAIQEYDIVSYRELFSVVSQDVFLFDGTIRENICLDRILSETELYRIVQASGLESFVHQVSHDYRVGDNGKYLSGGQRQKIALARALVYNRPIVIFDELTAHIDSISNSMMEGLLQDVLFDKTVIYVTHTKEHLKFASKIYNISKNKTDCLMI